MPHFDVAIVGGGPAGAAAAISLRTTAPEMRVCLIAQPPPPDVRIGETVPPIVRPLLEQLGLWDAFLHDQHAPSYRTVSSWGTRALSSNEFLLHAHGRGWRLDRSRFDSMMFTAARRAATEHRTNRVAIERCQDGLWSLRSGESSEISTARLAIDASGRRAVLMRRFGRRARPRDRMIASFMHVASAADEGEGAFVESTPHGWWYTAVLPRGRRVVACMTDSDIARRLELRRPSGWLVALGTTHYVKTMLPQDFHVGRPRLCAAAVTPASDPQGLPLLAAGDAAGSFDPLSSLGIVRALRSGLFAGYAAADYLRHKDPDSLRKFARLTAREFQSHESVRRDIYAREQRWPDELFWRRRQTRAD